MLVKDKIRQNRKALGLDTYSFARRIGVSQGNVCRYESGYVKKIPEQVLEKMAAVFECSIDDLIKDDPGYAHLQKPAQRKSLQQLSALEDDQLILEWFHSKSPEVQTFIKELVLHDMQNDM